MAGFLTLYRLSFIWDNKIWNIKKQSLLCCSWAESSVTSDCVYRNDSVSNEMSKFGNFEIPVNNPVGTVTQCVTELWTVVTLGCTQDCDFHSKSSCFGLKWGSEVWKVLNAAHKQMRKKIWNYCSVDWCVCVRRPSLFTVTGLQREFGGFLIRTLQHFGLQFSCRQQCKLL